MDATQLAQWLIDMPALTSSVFFPRRQRGGEELSEFLQERLYPLPTVPEDVGALASLVNSREGLMCLLLSVDVTCRRLLGQGAWAGGTLDLDALLDDWTDTGGAEAPTRPQLEAARLRLGRALLVDPPSRSGPWMQISADVLPLLDLPGNSAAEGLALAVSDELLATLKAVGVENPPRLRDERAALLAALLRQPDHLGKVISGLSPEAVAAFKFALGARGDMDASEMGFGMASFDRRYRRTYPGMGKLGPVYELYDVGLLGVDEYSHNVWVWREVMQTLFPRMINGWSVPAEAVPVPLDAAARSSAMAAPLSLLGRLIDEWRSQPPAALADGGLGVGPVRAIAKRMKVPSAHIGLLTHLAIEMGLLQSGVVGSEGRGRYAKPIYAWRLTPLADTWVGQPAVERWVGLVRQWLGDRKLDDRTGIPERWSFSYVDAEPLPRHLMLRALEALPAGVGADATDFGEHLWSRYPMLIVDQAHSVALVESMRALGLVPSSGPIGLTDQARLLLAGGSTDDLASLDESDHSGVAGGASVFVQADRTVTVLPEAPLDARLLLDRIAVLESDAGARLYRLTEGSVRAAIDAGLGATALVEQLQVLTGRELPQPVVHLVNDVERTKGRLMMASAVTVISSEDPVAIAMAVRVKAAKLRTLGPYTAVSLLAAEKVRAALAAKDVHVTVEASEPVPQRSVGHRAGPKGPAIQGSNAPLGYVGLRQIEAAAEDLLAGKRRGGGGSVG